MVVCWCLWLFALRVLWFDLDWLYGWFVGFATDAWCVGVWTLLVAASFGLLMVCVNCLVCRCFG